MRTVRLHVSRQGAPVLVRRVAPRPDEVQVRTSTEDRTMQVAGAVLGAMGTGTWPWAAYTQPSSVYASLFPLPRELSADTTRRSTRSYRRTRVPSPMQCTTRLRK